MKRAILTLIIATCQFFISSAQDITQYRDLNLTKLNDLADSLRTSGNFEEAIKINNELVSRYFAADMYDEGINSLNKNSPCYWRRGLLSKADSINRFVALLAKKHLPEHSIIIADLLFNKASANLFYGKFDSARIGYKNSYQILLKQDTMNYNKEINTLSNLGAAYYYEGDLDSALHYFEKSFNKEKDLFLREQLDTISEGFAQQYSNLAALYLQKGNNKKSLKYAKRSLDLVQQLNSRLELGYSNVSYGYVLARNGAYTQGLQYIEAGVKINYANEAYANPYNLDELTLLAEVYTWTEDFDKADSVLTQFFELCGKFDDHLPELSSGYMAKGNLEERRYNHEEAIFFYEKAIEHVKIQSENARVLAICYNNILINNFKLGRDSAALVIFEKASNISAENFGKSSIFWMGLQQEYGEYLLKHNSLVEARESFLSILEANKIKGIEDESLIYDPWFNINAMRGLAKINAEQESIDSLKKTISYYYKIDKGVNELRLSFLNFNDRIRISDSLNSIYDEAISFAIALEEADGTGLNDVFHFMESSKSYNLYQELRVNDITNIANSQTLFEFKSELESDISYYLEQLNKAQNAGDESKTILFQTKLSSLISERDGLNAEMNNNRSALELMKSSETISLEKVRSNLESKSVIIEYAITKSTVYAISITKADVKLVRLGNADELNSLIDEFLSNSTDRNSRLGVFKKSSYALFQFLFPDALTKSYSEVLIVPDEQLHTVPFEALIQDTTGESFKNLTYLINDFTIRYSQSMTLSDFLATKKSSYKNNLLALAPEFDAETVASIDLSRTERSSFVQIPGAQKEVDEIVKYFEATKLVGSDASKAALIKLAADYDIIHLATHGLVDNKNPLKSKILLSQSPEATQFDGTLYSYEILDFSINSEMVVLSACNSGVGEIYKGEGAMSLSSSFFYSGAKSVIMTQWQTNDLSTSEIMANFYQFLGDGHDKATALRLAKLEYLKTARNSQTHPYYWSQFVHYGKNDPLVRAFNYTLLGSILLAISSITIFVLLNRKSTYKIKV